MPSHHGYLRATRHPWPCFLFLLPLLLGYEAGVLWLGGARPAALRNGADTWLRWGLEAFGVQQLYGAPALVAAVFLAWSWQRRGDRPDDLIGVCSGMLAESGAFALGLWGGSHGLGWLLDALGVQLSYPTPTQAAVGRLVTFVGAGIYEEVLFRLILFSIVRNLLGALGLAAPLAVFWATATSALGFALAHHLGPYGEPFDGYVFLFRSLAGVYFALLYQLRGFGIAVGTHAGYDVLVGVLVQP